MTDDPPGVAPALCERCWFPVRHGHDVRWFERHEIVDGRVRTLVSVVHGRACPAPWNAVA